MFTQRVFRLLFLSCLFSVPSVSLAYSWSDSGFIGQTPEKLLARSISTGCGKERTHIRRYLAERYPNTSQGMGAKAYFASREDAVKLYKKCVARFPTQGLCHNNLASNVPAEEKIARWQALIKHTPNWLDQIGLYHHIQEILDQQGVKAAQGVLSKHQRRFGQSAMLGAAKAKLLSHQRQYARAQALLKRTALNLKVSSIEYYEKWQSIINDYPLPTAQQKSGYKTLIKTMLSNTENEYSLLLAAKIYKNKLKRYDDAFSHAFKSFYKHKTYTAAELIADIAHRYNATEHYAYYSLRTALKESPQRVPKAYELLATMYAATNRPEAMRESLLAFARTSHPDTKLANSKQAIHNALSFFADLKTAKQILHESFTSASDKQSAAYGFARYTIARFEGNYADAIKWGKQHSIFKTERATLQQWLKQEQARTSFYTEQPLMKYWDRNFGNAASVNVKFATGSDRVLPNKELDQVGSLINQPYAENYFFNIEGHTDSVGTEENNQRLSENRAASIRRYLIENNNVSAGRLLSSGKGESLPVANNASASGRRKNRRVEIVPMGRLNSPKVVAGAALDARGHVSLSKDGRIAAMGRYPIQIWNLETKTLKTTVGAPGGSYAISGNGRYLAVGAHHSSPINTGTKSDAIEIHDLKTGQLYHRQYLEARISKIAWSPFGDKIAAIDIAGYVYQIDVKTKQLIQVTNSSPTNISGPLVWSKNGDRIYVGLAQASKITVINAHSGKIVTHYDGVSWPHAIGMSPDGRYLLVHDNRRKLVRYDLQNGGRRKTIQLKQASKRIVFHPNKPTLVVDSWVKPYGLELVNYKTMRRFGTIKGVAYKALGGFTPNGDLYALSDNDSLIRYSLDKQTQQYQVHLRSTVDKLRDIYPADALGLFVVQREKSTGIWDVKEGRRLHTWDKSLDMFPITGNPSQFWAIDVNERRTIYLANLEDFSLTPAFKASDWIVQYKFSDKVLAAVTRPETDDDRVSAKKGQLEVYNLNTYQRTSSTALNFIDDPLRYGGKVYRTAYDSPMAINEDLGHVAIVTRWQDGYGHGLRTSKLVKVYDYKNHTLLTPVNLKKRPQRLAYKGKQLWAGKGNYYYHVEQGKIGWRTALNKEKFIEQSIPSTNTRIFADTSSQFKYQLSGATIKTLDFQNDLVSAAILPSAKLIVAGYRTGRIDLIHEVSHKKLLHLVADKRNEWMAYTPDGFYNASLNGTRGAYWSLGDLTLPFAKLADKNKKPDLIRNTLQLTATGKIEEQTQLASQAEASSQVSEALFNLPYRIANVKSLPKQTKQKTVQLSFDLAKMSANADKAQLSIMVNGQTVSSARGLQRISSSTTTSTVANTPACTSNALSCERKTFAIPLNDGLNVIQISVLYQKANIDSRSVTVTRNVPKPTLNTGGSLASTSPKGHQLWFFGIGVSKYADPKNNLDYADADAKALAASFKKQEGKLYEKVNVKILTNEEVTERNIKIAINRFIRKAAAQDTIVVFMAGHGVRDNDSTLYFMPHDGDPAEPYTGVNVGYFRDFLHKRPLNQKALMWMDICHAGSIGSEWGKRRGRVSADEAVKLLSEGTGVAVIASSTGMESSLEGPQYGGGHGAFTAALLEGLAGKADAKNNNDGMTSVLELQNYISRRVPEMTGGRQHPMTPSQVRLRDFPLGLH